jgi:membrane protein
MMVRLKKAIFKSRPYQALRNWTQTTLLPDKSASLYLVYKVFWRKFERNELLARADGVAFNFTLSVFPFVIFLFTLIPYIPIESLDELIMNFLGEILPRGIYEEAASTLRDIVSRRRNNLLSLGAILALYGGTAGMMALMSAFNKMYRTIENRSFIRTRLTAVGLTILLVLVMVIGIALLIVGEFILDWLVAHNSWIKDDWIFFSIQLLRYTVVLLVFFIGISTIYYIAPAIHKRWQFFSIGSITASILIILATQLFSYYISNFASYNRLYGSLGTFIALMVWFLLVSILLLIGFEINASIDEARIEARLQRIKSDRQYHQIRPGDKFIKKPLSGL